jgi:SAM-dependent methyltransferase
MTERPGPPSKRPTPSRSTTGTASSDWVGARGEKWRASLSGMEAMLTPVDEPLIHALHLEAPCRIAEIGCGGGGTALEILRRSPGGSVVHGFDISPAIIELARQRTRPEERAIAFEAADMASVRAPEEPYDRLVSRFGVMFFDDPPAAFANLIRWLSPGGRFAFAVWGALVDNPWMNSVREVTAEFVDLRSPDPEAPGPFCFAEVHKLLTLLEGAGFGELVARDWRGVLPIGGGMPAVEAAKFALASFSTFGELLAERGDGAIDRARRSLAERFFQHEKDGAVWMDACVHIVTGIGPPPGARRAVP